MGKKSRRVKAKQTEEEKEAVRLKFSEKCQVYAYAEHGGWRIVTTGAESDSVTNRSKVTGQED